MAIRVSPSSPKRDPAIKPSINPPINPPPLVSTHIHNDLSAKPADSSEEGWTYVSRFSRAQQGAGENKKMHKQGSRPQIREPERKRGRSIKADNTKRMAPSKSSSGWKFASGSMATPWSQICKMGRSMEDECRLDYVEPFKDPTGLS